MAMSYHWRIHSVWVLFRLDEHNTLAGHICTLNKHCHTEEFDLHDSIELGYQNGPTAWLH